MHTELTVPAISSIWHGSNGLPSSSRGCKTIRQGHRLPLTSIAKKPSSFRLCLSSSLWNRKGGCITISFRNNACSNALILDRIARAVFLSPPTCLLASNRSVHCRLTELDLYKTSNETSCLITCRVIIVTQLSKEERCVPRNPRRRPTWLRQADSKTLDLCPHARIHSLCRNKEQTTKGRKSISAKTLQAGSI